MNTLNSLLAGNTEGRSHRSIALFVVIVMALFVAQLSLGATQLDAAAPTGTVTGTAFVDVPYGDIDHDPASNVQLGLYTMDGALAYTTLVDNEGNFAFTDVSLNNYILGIASRSAFILTGNVDVQLSGASTDSYHELILVSPSDNTINTVSLGLGLSINRTIDGTVTIDVPYEGVADDPAANITIGLYTQDGELAYTTTTDSDGRFEFTNVASDEYVLDMVNDTPHTTNGDVDVSIPQSGTNQFIVTFNEGEGEGNEGNESPDVPLAVSLSNVQMATQTASVYVILMLVIGTAVTLIININRQKQQR